LTDVGGPLIPPWQLSSVHSATFWRWWVREWA